MVVYSFLFFLLLFVAIGMASSMKSKKSNADYLLAGHDISPWLAALSAVATNNSGYMFIGMIGYTYTSGLESVWLMVGWILGDLMASFFVHKRLRVVAEKNNILSFGGVLSRWQKGGEFKKLRLLVGLITVVFLGVYAAAQFKAGSKALHVLFGWDYSTGAIIGSVIVFLYCLSGGIRASIWTDAAQSIVMIFAMALLFVVGVKEVGGLTSYWSKLDAISPSYLSLSPSGLYFDNIFGASIFIIGWIFGGIGVIGQPHIMIRFMTIDDAQNMTKTKIYYYTWYVLFFTLTIGVGLTARLILPQANFDAELALPLMGQALLPQVLIGVVLAGIFSATMSTADSQILSCSASFTRDILPKDKDTLFITKLSTALITLGALAISLFGSSNVFSLVLISWSVLSAAFGPLIFIYAVKRPVSELTAILMVFNGVLVTLLWREFGLSSSVYEVAPGMITGFLTYYILQKTSWNKLNA